MKIKSRQQRLVEYNDKYSIKSFEGEKTLKRYFKERNWDYDKAIKKASSKLNKILENREYQTIRIIMYEYPMKTDRPRVFRSHTYSPNAASNHSYFDKCVKHVIKAMKLINTPAEITIDAYLEMPSQIKPDEVILFEAKVLDIIDMPDYDNIAKCYTDMLQDTLIVNDDLIHIGTVRKYYSVLPRVEISITYLKRHESEYIYKKIKSRKAVKEAIKNGMLDLDIIKY